MSRYLGKFVPQLVDETANEGRGAWIMLEKFAYESDVAGRTFCIPSDFHTDFESCPKVPAELFLLLFAGPAGIALFALLVWLLTTLGNISRQAAVVHDFLYQTQPISRGLADAVLREAAQVSGIVPWKAWGLWAGVRLGGWYPWYFRRHQTKRPRRGERQG